MFMFYTQRHNKLRIRPLESLILKPPNGVKHAKRCVCMRNDLCRSV